MIDLHSHILPDWDDGARNWEETRRMCEIAKEDGIERIMATPHIYRLNKHDGDWTELEARFAELGKRAVEWGITVGRGAEVFVHHAMAKEMRERNLTLNGTSYVFVEFPEEHVLSSVRDLIYSLMLENYIPIISHPERNRVFTERPDLLYDLIAMGALAQVTGKSVSGGYGAAIQKTAQLFLRHNLVQIIASDAHDTERRPPRLGAAVKDAGEVVGADKALAMATAIPLAVLENRPIPDWGEAENPVKPRKKLAFRIPWGKSG